MTCPAEFHYRSHIIKRLHLINFQSQEKENDPSLPPTPTIPSTTTTTTNTEGDGPNSETPPSTTEEDGSHSFLDSNSSSGSCEYELIGVTVHTGTADGGHYYSFIRDRSNTAESYLASRFVKLACQATFHPRVGPIRLSRDQQKLYCYGTLCCENCILRSKL